jgi:ASC-1-like (ASCH) protein
MQHILKIEQQFADVITSGDKTFEIRKNDRAYQKGDKVKFQVIDLETKALRSHCIHNKLFEITYVLSNWGIESGYVVFGIKEVIDE